MGNTARLFGLWPVWLLALLLASCPGEGVEVAGGPRAWIDAPLDGARLPLAPVIVESHVSDQEGVAEVELYVNGELVRVDASPDPSARLVSLSQLWSPAQPGEYALHLRVTNAAGAYSESASVRVQVGDFPTQTQTPTSTPELNPDAPTLGVVPGQEVPSAVATDEPGAAIAIASDTPLPPTPTFTPVPPTQTFTHVAPTPSFTPSPTVTSIPPVQVSFTADATGLQAGQCTTLRWNVQFATAVFLNGAGVPGNATQQVCPAQTTTYNLHVEAPSGNVDQSITIQVTLPPSDTPPPPTNMPTPTTAAPTFTISGVVFNDGDGDQARDGNEAGLPNVGVEVRQGNCGGVVLASQLTAGGNNSGVYSFGNLPVGSYCVRVYDPPDGGWTATTPDQVVVNLGPNSVVNFGYVFFG